MTTLFETKYEDKILGKLTTVNRVIFNGYLTRFYLPGFFKRFLSRQGVLLKDFSRHVQKATATIKQNALKTAEDAGRPYMYFKHTVRHKDDLAKRIAKKDGITQGLICVLGTLELRHSFEIQPNKKTHQLDVVRRLRKCIHYYFYYIDSEFGFMHARVQSWFPFEIQVYINGREWLARQLDKRGMGYQRYENASLSIDDLETAQRLCERLRHRKWPRYLNAVARRINPWLCVVRKHARGYYWVIDECEVATDVMWRDRASLTRVVPELFDYAIRAFSATNVMRFPGRKFCRQAPIKGKAVTELDDLCRSRSIKGKQYSKFNPVSAQDCALFRAVLAGEHLINGFRNRNLQAQLYSKPPSSPQEANSRCSRVCRLIRKLRGHRLIAKVPRSRLYRVTARGQRIMSAALLHRDVGFPDTLASAA